MSISSCLRAGVMACLFCGAAPGARAEPLEPKLCLLLAAERLPAIPGIEIKSASVAVEPVPKVSPDLVANFPDPLRGLDDLTRRFGLVPGERDLAIRRAAARGETDNARSQLVAMLNGTLQGAARAEIGVRAVGLEASYGFLCVWRSQKDVVVAPLGLLR